MATLDNVELLPHHPEWNTMARKEADLLATLLGQILITVCHIGSTAIPTIAAKPILDLLPVVSSLEALDQHRERMEEAGYQWRGEYGLPGRRYCTKADPVGGHKRVHLHFYRVGSPEIDRHVAFRDYLLHRPDLASAYHQEKARCQQLHCQDSRAYSHCKREWIKRVEAEALIYYGVNRSIEFIAAAPKQ